MQDRLLESPIRRSLFKFPVQAYSLLNMRNFPEILQCRQFNHWKYSVSWRCAKAAIFLCIWSSEICKTTNSIKSSSLFYWHRCINLLIWLEIHSNLSAIIGKMQKSLKLSSLRSALAFGALFFDIWRTAGHANHENEHWSRNAYICQIKIAWRPMFLQNLCPFWIILRFYLHCWSV